MSRASRRQGTPARFAHLILAAMSPVLILSALLLAAPAMAQEQPAAVALTAGGQEEAPAAANVAEPVIPLETNDAAIGRRLSGLYSELSGLGQIRADVRSGVVTLSGTALTAEDRQRAESIASRLAGVASVENEITVESNVGKRLQPLVERARSLTDQIVAFLPLLMVALVVFIAVWLVGHVLTRRMALFARVAPNALVRTLIGQIVRLVFIIIGLILAMRILGATALLGSVLGAAGVFGLAVGFAIRDTIENYIASILLSIRRPFAPNDLVVIEGFEGRVTRLNSRATFLTTLAGNEVRIPNAIVYKSKIENFTSIPERRFEFTVGIGYENDLCSALAAARHALLETDGVLSDPEPKVLADELGDSTVVLRIMGWMDQDQSDFYKTRSAAIRSVKTEFEQHGISMPEPIHNVRMLGEPAEGGAPASGEKIEAGDGAEPTAADAEAVADTSPDRTIESKVDQLREGPGEDLLTPTAPRE